MALVLIGLALGFLIARLTLATQRPKPNGGTFMYIVKDNNPDVGYQLTLGEVKDAEGVVIPDAQVQVAITSDNADVVAVTPDPSDPKKGTIHFGAPGKSSLLATVSSGDKVLAAIGAQFLVTAGDPASIAGGNFGFDGLTEAPAPPAQ